MAEPEGERLATSYDLVMLDLDGVVYIDGRAVDHAAGSIEASRTAGAHVAFITNNAARPPEQVAEHLRELGVDADPADVVTSSQAAARLLRDHHGDGAPGSRCWGRTGCSEALREAGLVPVPVGDSDAVAIVTGYATGGPVDDHHAGRGRDPERPAVGGDQHRPDAAHRRGPAPGHGALVTMISRFAGVEPGVAGKPERPLFDETLRRVGG